MGSTRFHQENLQRFCLYKYKHPVLLVSPFNFFFLLLFSNILCFSCILCLIQSMAPPNLFSESRTSNTTPVDFVAKSRFSLTEERNLAVDGVTLFSHVPSNVTLSSFTSLPHLATDTPDYILESVSLKSNNGSFLGLSVEEPADRILNPIGNFFGRKFLSIFRFKTWWSTMWVGSNGSDLQMETQLILLRVPELDSYVLVLPLIEGSFRSAIHPGKHEGEVVLCVESGSEKVKGKGFSSCAYLHIGDNPFDLMRDAFAAVRVHLGSYRLLEEKTPPKIIDSFGWCSWDAFYLTVEPVGLWHGVKSFVENGFPPRFLIIDDGWQSINMDHENPFEDSKDLTGLGSQMLCRLYRFKENDKFAKYQAGTMLSSNAPAFDQDKHDKVFEEMIAVAELKKKKLKEDGEIDISDLPEPKIIEYFDEKEGVERGGLKALVSDLRERFPSLEDVYVWHALCGAWGGVRPETTHLDAKVAAARLAAGLQTTMPDLAVDMIIQGGIGLVNPDQATEFYDAMHFHLADAGITGVKVDVMHALEYVAEDYGGRVQLAKAYYDGLSQSLKNNFGGSGLIASMEQCNDFFFLATKQISMGRVGDDFWFEDPNGDPMGVYWLQGVHMIHCSYNSLWQGQFIQPDWDMFQSNHLCAEFHAGSRAICGGPVYVSDKVGGHNFVLLRKLVFPDGTILRCQHYALPTRDCLFENPLFDGKTLLKIWNLNKYVGVVGAFNCQGAGWYPEERKCKAYPQCYKSISGMVSPDDVEWEQKDSTVQYRKAKQFAVYLHKSDTLNLVNSKDQINITLQPSSFDIFTISPVHKLNEKAKFAPIGLENMFNSGGAIEFLDYGCKGSIPTVKIQVKGTGKFLAFSCKKPREIILNAKGVEFEWSSNGILRFEVPWTGGKLSNVLILMS
ncbi:stachyose synthase-like isoform X2 [Tripterygium wilfordii]|uniref:stachyose synthase-like isoform X2 n=1 Tax=Tripterygium wilfordii TaxID=458696 RepID=UPI0018F7F87B|nr:stachyose synthase-like isoform X2 [Tripterygium wilfordii]